MALIRKEFQQKSYYTLVLLMAGTLLLNQKAFNLNRLGMVPVVISTSLLHIFKTISPALGGLSTEEEQPVLTGLALLIASLQAVLLHERLIAVPFQWGSTLALLKISQEITQKGIGNGLTDLFTLQLIERAFQASRSLPAGMKPAQVLALGASLLPLLGISLIYMQQGEHLWLNRPPAACYTTYQLTPFVSITLYRQPAKPLTFAIRSAACGALPMMYAMSLWQVLNLGTQALWLYLIVLFVIYVVLMHQSINSFQIAKHLKTFHFSFPGVRPGKETQTFLSHYIHRAIAKGTPCLLIMGLYPFLYTRHLFTAYLAQCLPFLVCDMQLIWRELQSYRLDFKKKGALLC